MKKQTKVNRLSEKLEKLQQKKGESEYKKDSNCNELASAKEKRN